MIISDTPPFVIFQPWKCASTTLHHRLNSYQKRGYPQHEYFNEQLGQRSSKHITCKDFVKLQEAQSPRVRVVFVRNPYDRLYSGYLQRFDRLTRTPPNWSVDQTKQELLLLKKGFTHWLEYYCNKNHERLNLFHNYVYFFDRWQVDFIGFVETLDKSLDQISKIIGISETEKINANMRTPLPHDLTYKYIDKYKARDIRLVNRLFSDDFSFFGYRKISPNLIMRQIQLFGKNKYLLHADALPMKGEFALKLQREASIV